jgi:hypothetical protein
MKGGVLLYKCRRCGVESERFGVPDLLVALSSIASGKWPSEWCGFNPETTNLHVCGDGRYGISDLIGGDEDKEPGR